MDDHSSNDDCKSTFEFGKTDASPEFEIPIIDDEELLEYVADVAQQLSKMVDRPDLRRLSELLQLASVEARGEMQLLS